MKEGELFDCGHLFNSHRIFYVNPRKRGRGGRHSEALFVHIISSIFNFPSAIIQTMKIQKLCVPESYAKIDNDSVDLASSFKFFKLQSLASPHDAFSPHIWDLFVYLHF